MYLYLAKPNKYCRMKRARTAMAVVAVNSLHGLTRTARSTLGMLNRKDILQ